MVMDSDLYSKLLSGTRKITEKQLFSAIISDVERFGVVEFDESG